MVVGDRVFGTVLDVPVAALPAEAEREPKALAKNRVGADELEALAKKESVLSKPSKSLRSW